VRVRAVLVYGGEKTQRLAFGREEKGKIRAIVKANA